MPGSFAFSPLADVFSYTLVLAFSLRWTVEIRQQLVVLHDSLLLFHRTISVYGVERYEPT